MARPRKEINFEQFESLVAMQNTIEDIAFFFSVSVDSLRRRCAEHYHEGFETLKHKFGGRGRMKLVNLLWKHAEVNPNTAHFLAKNWLKMADAPVQINNTNINQVEQKTNLAGNLDFGAEEEASKKLAEEYDRLITE